jgi:hypothetical protein
MKIQPGHNVLGQDGCFFEGEVPGSVCFVPLTAIKEGKLDEGGYNKGGHP